MSNHSRKDIEDRFTEACELHSRAEFTAAEKIYASLLEQVPEAGMLHYNIGLLYYQTEDFKKALVHYSTARDLAPQDSDLLFNYALCQKKLGQLRDAASSFRELIQISPNDPDTLYNLGNCYKELKEHKKAVKSYQLVLNLEPNHLPAIKNLAYLFHILDDTENALAYYNRVLHLDPDNPQAIHMISALTGAHIDSTPSEYIKDIFNSYSETFDEALLDGLKYAVPEKLRSLFDALGYPVKFFSRCIDLGCGTGLAGNAFGELCKHLTGVDLSEKMIEKAMEKDIYDVIQVAEITKFLKGKRDEYDLAVAADVLTYLGDLDPVFSALTNATKKQALFCCSTENSDQPHFHLCTTGRFAHSQDYVLKTAARYGWKAVNMTTTTLRKEESDWVEGTLYFLNKI
jgi:predicted TPR repeat methyltransferase